MNREQLSLYSMAARGITGGIYKYCVKPELTAKRAWGVISLGVLAYELACPEGELLSEGVDRAIDSHKALTLGAIAVTSLHLANVLPQRIDPFSVALKALKGGNHGA